MVHSTTSMGRWLDIIRSEFREMPGMALTDQQFQRLWGLDRATMDEAIRTLMDGHFLIRTRDGRYARSYDAPDSGRSGGDHDHLESGTGSH